MYFPHFSLIEPRVFRSFEPIPHSSPHAQIPINGRDETCDAAAAAAAAALADYRDRDRERPLEAPAARIRSASPNFRSPSFVSAAARRRASAGGQTRVFLESAI
jgi:hypothetical protein